MSEAAAVFPCTSCGTDTRSRSREQLADALDEAIHFSTKDPSDWVKRFQCLTAHLMWLSAELRGKCCSCTLQQAAQDAADFRAQVAGMPTSKQIEEQVVEPARNVIPFPGRPR